MKRRHREEGRLRLDRLREYENEQRSRVMVGRKAAL